MHDDPRPILPPPARRVLTRLTASVEKAHAGAVLSIAVRRVGEAGCRVHPFDLPALARHIKGDAESLGLAERAYLALTATDSEDEGAKSLFFDHITTDNWTTFPKASRRAFVADVRRQDAAAGRALVETVWKMEPAPMRVALLEALATSLGPDDKTFLDSLSGDRAESVKLTAARLLARMPSTEEYAQRLVTAAACFKRPTKGIVAGLMNSIGLGGDGVVFTPPEGAAKDSKNWTERQAARQHLFAGLRIAELAAAAGATPDEIIVALPPDEQPVLMLLLDAAVIDGDIEAVRRIVGQCLLSCQTLPAHLLMQLADKVRATLAPSEAERFLAAPAWIDTIKAFREATTPAQLKDDGRLIFTAVLMPRATMPAFIRSLAHLSPASTRSAKDFADLVLALPDTAPSLPT
jgi:hypothetical protein